MGITLICPSLSCRKTLVVPGDSRGKTVRCPYCRKPFVVPDGASQKSSAEEEKAPKV